MEKNNKTTGKRKFLKTAIIVLILVGFPAVSWYYLKQGVNWRKTAVSELRDYGKIPAVSIIYPNNEKEDQVKSKVCVVHMFGENPDLNATNQHVLDTGQKLYEQFGQNEYFRLVMVAQGGTAEFKTHAQTLPSADYATWVWSGALGKWSTILLNGYDFYTKQENVKPVPSYYALTDTSGIIRRFYNADDEKEVGRMVEQIAILLPR